MAKNPWDRNQGFKASSKYAERESSYKRFVDYLNLGPGRTFQAAAVAGGVTPQAIYQIATRYNWIERAQKWDKEQARLERAGKRAAAQKPPPLPSQPAPPPPNPDEQAPNQAVEAEVVPGPIQTGEKQDGYAKGLDEFRKVYGRLGYSMALESHELFPTIKQLREDIARMMRLRRTNLEQGDQAAVTVLSEVINKQIPQYAKFCETMINLAEAGRKHWGAVVGIEEILEEAYGNKASKKS